MCLTRTLALMFGLAACLGAVPSWALEVTGGSCRPREAVEAAARAPYERAAMDFAAQLVRGDLSQAYASLTEDLKAAVPLDKFAAAAKANGEALKSLAQLHVAQSYFVETTAAIGNGQFVPCLTSPKASASDLDGKVFVSAKSLPRQAHVVVEGTNQTGVWTISLWLIPDHDVWRVQGMHEAPPSSLDMPAAELWTVARAQQQKGHSLNAFLIYGAVGTITFRGPNFQLGIWADSQKAAKELSLPAEVQGQPPFVWHLGESVFRVLSMTAAVDDGKLALDIFYQADPAADQKRLEEQNRDFIRELRIAHPDYFEGFDSIMADAVLPSGQRVRTIEKIQL